MTDADGPFAGSADDAASAIERLNAGPEARLQTLRRLASEPAARDDRVWAAIDAFAGAGRWNVVLELIDRHEFDLDPWRMTPLRVRALIELGWHRRALQALVWAYESGYVRGNEAVELLVEWGALALAANFIVAQMSEDLWQGEARASVIAAATRTGAAADEHEAPLRYADAIQAQDLLLPGREQIGVAVGRALGSLKANAAQRLANDDPVGATAFLAAAARLAPTDRSLLDALADAAFRANLSERRLDTVLRIWTTQGDVSSLLAVARGILETASWEVVAEVMTTVSAERGSLGPEIDAIADRYGAHAAGKVEDHIRVGDIASGLELVNRVSRQFPDVKWPDGLLSRLLRATKRALRGQQRGGAALTASLGPLYLELAPCDVDVSRMVGKVRLRQRRLREAREMLGRVVAINPHVASDWVALAMVQADLGELDGRDLSVARALLIAPDAVLPQALAPVRERMGLA